MPVFTLSELAIVAGKSPDTMRDWFDRGFFGEAGRRTPGGQRRVRAASAEKAVAAARLHTTGYERRRLGKCQTAIRDLARLIDLQMDKFDDLMEFSKLAKLSRSHRFKLAGKRAELVADTFFSASPDVLAKLGFGNNTNVEKALWEIHFAGQTGDSVIMAALCILIADSGDWTKESTARRAGITDHEFNVFFGRYWDSARNCVEERLVDCPDMIPSWGGESLDKNTGKAVRQKQGTAMPPRWIQTDEERRKQIGSLRVAQRSQPSGNPFDDSED
jgi:hypothetical protein